MLRLVAIAALLISSAAVAASDERPAPQKVDSRDKIVCKRFAETGSLVASKKVCKSRRDWDRERDLIQESTRSTPICGPGGAPGACG